MSDDLDPRIAPLVLWLQACGYTTTESAEDRENNSPNVVIQVPDDADLRKFTDGVVNRIRLALLPHGGPDNQAQVEASY